jgi:AcrR family transcriptional regulator
MNKGEKTRLQLIEEARELFNTRGTNLTITQISRELGHGKSKITNHFPRKSDLIAAILERYNKKVTQVILTYSTKEFAHSFHDLIVYYGTLLDLMFAHRGVIIDSLNSSVQEDDYKQAVYNTYKANVERLRMRVQSLIHSGLLDPVISEPRTFKIFEIQHMNFLSTWFITMDLYHWEEGFHKMKPLYIKTILTNYLPFVTHKGEADLRKTFDYLDGLAD